MAPGYCSYSISDQYAPTTRFLFYTMVLLGLFGARIKYKTLVSTTLSAVLLFSCVTAIHACIVTLTSVHGNEPSEMDSWPDMDAIPAMTITSVAAILAGPIFTASRTLRKSVTSAFRLAFALSFFPALCSIVMWGAIGWPMENCSVEENKCWQECAGSLGGRDGQVVVFPKTYTILMIVHSILTLSPTISSFVLMVEFLPKHLYEKMAKDQRMHKLKTCFYVFNLIVAVVVVVIAEFILMGPNPVPFNESFSSIGIWGPAGVTVMALVAAGYHDWQEQRDEERLTLPYRKTSFQTAMESMTRNMATDSKKDLYELEKSSIKRLSGVVVRVEEVAVDSLELVRPPRAKVYSTVLCE